MQELPTLALGKTEITLFQGLDGLDHPCLIRYSGTEPGRRLDLDEGLLVMGRSREADVPVDGAGISRRHASLLVSAESVELTDLGSANATYVNDQRVCAPVKLKDGDLVRLANVVFRFHERRSVDVALHDRLYRMATVDPGTGVFNRRYAQDALKHEFARARRCGESLALICCDLDHFKDVNDRHGHAAGDVVLKDCAARLRAVLRAGDLIGRWGGEEFIVLARDTPADHALGLAERLRLAVAEHLFMLPGADAAGLPHRQTLSLGVAVQEAAMPDEHALLAVADRRMYAAKRAGRNRVVASD